MVRKKSENHKRVDFLNKKKLFSHIVHVDVDGRFGGSVDVGLFLDYTSPFKKILLFEQLRVFGHNVHLGHGDGAVDVDGWFGGGVDAGLFLENASILKKWFLMFAFFLTESLLTPAEA